ncbi:hypothetical protein HPB52_001059 [Rhipicephalus sanguineus]|uniref:Uncharacterized protein n=1 Tax=Rhipicephalus sanguineus TaxID=34632 RepID=A0A9D4QGA6_RHISA|nr:hypothetical protein HPB52_001059 [Rhipicephalus sanguineus]
MSARQTGATSPGFVVSAMSATSKLKHEPDVDDAESVLLSVGRTTSSAVFDAAEQRHLQELALQFTEPSSASEVLATPSKLPLAPEVSCAAEEVAKTQTPKTRPPSLEGVPAEIGPERSVRTAQGASAVTAPASVAPITVSLIEEPVTKLQQASDMKLIAEMQAEIDDLEWRSRRLNLEFHGIPKTEPEDLLSKINEIAAQLHLDTLDVAAVHRLPSRPDRIPAVIVRFTRQEVRDKWLAGRRALRIANSNVYVSENMTKRSRDLLSKCKEWIKRSSISQTSFSKSSVHHVAAHGYTYSLSELSCGHKGRLAGRSNKQLVLVFDCFEIQMPENRCATRRARRAIVPRAVGITKSGINARQTRKWLRDPFFVACGKMRTNQNWAPKAPDIRGEDEEASAAEQPPTGRIDDFDRLAQQVPDVEATAATTDQELPLLRRSKRIRKPIKRF